MKNYFFIFIAIILMSCFHMYMPPQDIQSPSKLYKFTATINQNVNKSACECVVLKLYDSSYRQLDTLQTGASYKAKWAAGWNNNQDTIILNSKDIGIYAWRLSVEHKLTNIRLSKEIKQESDVIFDRKYNGQTR